MSVNVSDQGLQFKEFDVFFRGFLGLDFEVLKKCRCCSIEIVFLISLRFLDTINIHVKIIHIKNKAKYFETMFLMKQ